MFFFYIIKLIFIDYLTFKLEIKYILPVFAGERIYLYRDGNMITGMVQRSGCGSDENKGIKVFEIKCKGD